MIMWQDVAMFVFTIMVAVAFHFFGYRSGRRDAKPDLSGKLLIDIQTGEVLSGTLSIAIIRKIMERNPVGHHLTRSQGKGSRKAKKEAECLPQPTSSSA